MLEGEGKKLRSSKPRSATINRSQSGGDQVGAGKRQGRRPAFSMRRSCTGPPLLPEPVWLPNLLNRLARPIPILLDPRLRLRRRATRDRGPSPGRARSPPCAAGRSGAGPPGFQLGLNPLQGSQCGAECFLGKSEGRAPRLPPHALLTCHSFRLAELGVAISIQHRWVLPPWIREGGRRGGCAGRGGLPRVGEMGGVFAPGSSHAGLAQCAGWHGGPHPSRSGPWAVVLTFTLEEKEATRALLQGPSAVTVRASCATKSPPRAQRRARWA